MSARSMSGRSLKSVLIAAGLLASLAPQAMAGGYGSAGCGLGSVLFGAKNTIVSQTAAMTTNGSFSSEFFGITSGTSNCNSSGLVMLDKRDVYYAEANFEALTIEMAKGKGERLSAFAEVLGCPDTALSDFGRLTQDKYQEIYPTSATTPVQMLDSLKLQMSKNPTLSQQCKPVS